MGGTGLAVFASVGDVPNAAASWVRASHTRIATDLSRVQAYLQAARHPYPFEGIGDLDDRPLVSVPTDIHPIVTGGVGIKMTYLPIWSGGSVTVTKPVRKFG